MRKWISVFAISLFVACTAARAADLPGAHEPAFLMRYQGSDIVEYISRPYDQYIIALDAQGAKSQTIEGQVTRLLYHVPPTHSALELLRNYEGTLEGKGFHRVYEHPVGGGDAGYVDKVYQQSWEPHRDSVAGMGGMFNWANLSDIGAVVEKGSIAGHDTTVVMMAVDCKTDASYTFDGLKDPVHLGPAELAVVVDIITSAQIKTNMVVVKAADMADALATKGVVDLYGIYFDTDKADVKPDSTATLDEIANLLKIDRSLKLEISGHTDNTGAKDHNLKLSQARANAVVWVLTKKYGIDAKRLTAKGYGDTKPVATNATADGKAKNRRVELRKI